MFTRDGGNSAQVEMEILENWMSQLRPMRPNVLHFEPWTLTQLVVSTIISTLQVCVGSRSLLQPLECLLFNRLYVLKLRFQEVYLGFFLEPSLTDPSIHPANSVIDTYTTHSDALTKRLCVSWALTTCSFWVDFSSIWNVDGGSGTRSLSPPVRAALYRIGLVRGEADTPCTSLHLSTTG